MNTYAIRAAGRKEQAIKDDLEEHGIAVNLPMCRQMRRQRKWRRHKEVLEPILPGYLFADVPDRLYYIIRDHKHVMTNGIFPLSRADMLSLAKFMQAVERGDYNHDGPYGHLQPGQIMQITGGVFAGLQMSFERVRDNRIQGLVETTFGWVRADVDGYNAEVA